MRKLILLALLFCTFAVFAQDKTRPSTTTYKLMTDADKAYALYTGVAADTITDNQDSISVQFMTGKIAKIEKFSVRVSMDKVTGTPKDSFILQGKIFEGDSWTSIANQVWAGSADSAWTFTITPTKTHVHTIGLTQSAGTLIYDTTKVVYKANTVKDSTMLWSAAITHGTYAMTETETATDNSVYYRYFRVLMIDKDTGTKGKIIEIEVKVFYL